MKSRIVKWNVAFCILVGVPLGYLLIGCAANRRNLATAHDTYQATMRTLTDYRRAGRISDEDAAKIEDASAAALEALRAWQTAVASGETDKARIQSAAFWAAMSKLSAQKRELKENNDG